MTNTGRPRGAPGYRIHQGATGRPVIVARLPVCGGLETALQIARTAPLAYSVPMLDALAHPDHRRMGDLASLIERRPGGRGMARARRAVSFANPLAESILESLGRLLIALGDSACSDGSATSGRSRTDLSGGPRIPGSASPDRVRRSRKPRAVGGRGLGAAAGTTLTNAGWIVLRFTWAQVMFKPEVVLRTIRAALMNGTRV